MIAKNKKTWGGERRGTGRPRITAKAYYFKADKDLIKVLDTQENRNRFINDAIRDKAKADNLI